MEADGVDSFGFHRTAAGGVKKAKKKSRLNQRQRRNLKKQKMAEMLQPEIITLSDDEYMSEPEDLRIALEAKKQAQTCNVKNGSKTEATGTGGPDDLRSILKGKKPESSTITVGELATSLDELEPESLARQGSLEIPLVDQCLLATRPFAPGRPQLPRVAPEGGPGLHLQEGSPASPGGPDSPVPIHLRKSSVRPV